MFLADWATTHSTLRWWAMWYCSSPFPADVHLAGPRGLGEVPGLGDSVTALLTPGAYDGVTMATPLDLLRQNKGLLLEDLYAQAPQFGQWAGIGWEWVNIAFLGGLWLIYQGIFTWHAPVGMLVMLGLCAAAGFDSGSSKRGSPLFHWLSGADVRRLFISPTP